MGASDIFDHIGSPLDAIFVLYQPEVMLGVNGLGLNRCRFMSNGICLIVPAQYRNIAIQRRREHQRLTRRRCLIEDTSDVGQETHVGHAVGFVDHDIFGLTEVDRSLVNEVLESTWGSDEDVNTPPELVLLWPVPNPAVYGRHVPAVCLRQRHQIFLDLLSQLASRRQNQGMRTIPAWRARR